MTHSIASSGKNNGIILKDTTSKEDAIERREREINGNRADRVRETLMYYLQDSVEKTIDDILKGEDQEVLEIIAEDVDSISEDIAIITETMIKEYV